MTGFFEFVGIWVVAMVSVVLFLIVAVLMVYLIYGLSVLFDVVQNWDTLKELIDAHKEKKAK